MECDDVVTRTIERLTDAGGARDDRALDEHLESCAACRAEVEAAENAWVRLGSETLRRRVVSFRSRKWMPALQAAAMLVTGVGGYLLARARTSPLPPSASVSTVPVASRRVIDASKGLGI